METSLCSNPLRTTNTNQSFSRRQSTRHETYSKKRELGSSTLSLPFNFETSNPTWPRKAQSQRRKCPRRDIPRIQAMVREFIQSIKYYRAYQIHSKLNLPTTTNTVEAMCCIVRDLLRRNRCASSPKSLLQWTTALIRLRKELKCNGKIINRID